MHHAGASPHDEVAAIALRAVVDARNDAVVRIRPTVWSRGREVAGIVEVGKPEVVLGAEARADFDTFDDDRLGAPAPDVLFVLGGRRLRV